MDPKGVSFQPSVPETPSTSGAKKRRGTPSSGSKFVQELLTPPGKHSKRKTDYEQLLSQFNKIPSQESLALVAALGAIVLIASFAVPYWSYTSYRGIVHQLRRDYHVYSRIGSVLGLGLVLVPMYQSVRRWLLQRQLAGLVHLTPMQRVMLGLPQGHTSPAAAVAKRKEVGDARKASDQKRARSAQRKPPNTPTTPAGTFGGRAKRFSEMPAVRGMHTPGSTRASVLQSPELLNASTVSLTSAGHGGGLDMSMDDLFSPGPPSGKLGSKSPRITSPAVRGARRGGGGWQSSKQNDDVFDASTLDKLLRAPSRAGSYAAADAAAVRMPAGVAGAAQIRRDLGVTPAELSAMSASLKQWLAEHIATVFLPTFEANAVALHAAYENVPGVKLSKDFLLRTGEVAMRTQEGQVLTLGKLISWYTDPKNAQHCRTRELRLSASQSTGNGTLEEWNTEYDERHGANSLPESAARFWMSCAARRLSRSRETGQRGEDAVGPSSARLTVSLWHERAQLERFFDLLGRYTGSDRFEYMKNYALRRLAAMGHSGMTSFQGEGGAGGGSTASAAAAAEARRDRSAGMPSDAFIVLCYFIAVLDAAMANTYPGEVGQMANGGMGVLGGGDKAGSRGRFSARHVAEGSSVSDGISEGDRPVLHIVSGAGGGEVHCRLLLNDIAYDAALDGGSSGRAAAYKEAEEGQSLWRTLALMLHCIDKRSAVREHFRSFNGVLDSVAAPALRARVEDYEGHLTYDQFFLN